MKKMVLIILCALVYCVPLSAVVYISNKEAAKYTEDTDFDFEISA